MAGEEIYSMHCGTALGSRSRDRMRVKGRRENEIVLHIWQFLFSGQKP